MKPLRVNASGLQRLSGQFTELACHLGATTGGSAPAAGSSWQSSVAEAAVARSAAVRQRAVFAARIQATAEKIVGAGSAYSRCDAGSATALSGQMV